MASVEVKDEVVPASLWANAVGHPSIWIRWTEVHESWVETDTPMRIGGPGEVTTLGRLVDCGRYGQWYVGDWRPMCARCHGTGQVEVHVDREAAIAAIVDTLDAGLLYMTAALGPCGGCLGHPGWVVG
jgi:hypothetical protein